MNDESHLEEGTELGMDWGKVVVLNHVIQIYTTTWWNMRMS